MSHAQPESSSDGDAEYPRDNYFHDLSAADDGVETPDRDWGSHHSFKDYDKHEAIAHSLLRNSATMLCARTLFAPPNNGGRLAELCAWLFDDECIDGHGDALHTDNRAVELTDPELHVPKNAGDQFGTHEYGQYRHRRRLNPETGYVSGGESTAVVIQDRSEEQFLALIREWLDACHSNLRDWKRQATIRYARRLKRGGDQRDVDVLTKIVTKVRTDDFDRE